MKSTPLPSGLPVSHYIESLYRIRGDRVFANVQLPLRDLVKTAQNVGQFDEVSGALHNPDEEGFHLAGSYKTQDQYGNLQLTFFANTATPPKFKVDADIDDAQGIGHIFQVLRNWLTGRETHPYDIHQILVRHQKIDPGYELIV